MGKGNDLTSEAREGFNAAPGTQNPYLETSSASMAWYVGRWFKDTGRPEPHDVRPSRGYRMHAGDMLLDVTRGNRIERIC